MHGHRETEMDEATRLIFIQPIEVRGSDALSAAVLWIELKLEPGGKRSLAIVMSQP